MVAFRVIVIGGSAGGITALTRLLPHLPKDLRAPVCLALHLSRHSESRLPEVLGRATRLPIEHAIDAEELTPGRIYIAPPDHHLLIDDGRLRLSHGPNENGHRPSIDVLFRSAAQAFGDRMIGVILSGALDDGTAGLRDIKRYGGIAIVQDPEDATTPSMPASAIANVRVDYIATVDRIARLLVEICSSDRPETFLRADPPPGPPIVDERKEGAPSPFACPTCGGALWERDDGDFMRFRCRTGHAFSQDSFDSMHDVATDDALWSAVRALEERVAISRRFGERAQNRGHTRVASTYFERADRDARRAEVARRALLAESDDKEPAES